MVHPPLPDDGVSLALLVGSRETSHFLNSSGGRVSFKVGYWKSPKEIEGQRSVERRFEPGLDAAAARAQRARWRQAVERTLGWDESGAGP